MDLRPVIHSGVAFMLILAGLVTAGLVDSALRSDPGSLALENAAVRQSPSLAAGESVSTTSAKVDASIPSAPATDSSRPYVDIIKQMQFDAVSQMHADWGYWGSAPERYSTWINHSNRLTPIYTFGISLDRLREEGSPYADPARLEKLYGSVPQGTLNENATYFDQSDVYRLQQQALAEGKTRIILFIFDGMDWDSTRDAALYKTGEVAYTEGRGTGLTLQDYRGTVTDFGYFVTSPRLASARIDVDAQTVLNGDQPATGGYDPTRGGTAPWNPPPSREYLMGLDRLQPHAVTDSAASATSMTAGIKTYNAAINVDVHGRQVETLAHQLQRDRGFAIGIVTSVPISHATPAAAYAHNVTREDYQDLTRDLIGLPSVSHKHDPLPGVDVLIGGGWGEALDQDPDQGANFVPGREFYDPEDLRRVSVERGGKYVVAQRTPGEPGAKVLRDATETAINQGHRLLAVFGAVDGHLPFATADGRYDPTIDAQGETKYRPEDITENPLLADMAVAALEHLDRDPEGFWLMIEAGDVDWANHANNIDSSIGAVLSGDQAVRAVFDWIESKNDWSRTAVIVTADHGHHFMLRDPAAVARAGALRAPE